MTSISAAERGLLLMAGCNNGHDASAAETPALERMAREGLVWQASKTGTWFLNDAGLDALALPERILQLAEEIASSCSDNHYWSDIRRAAAVVLAKELGALNAA